MTDITFFGMLVALMGLVFAVISIEIRLSGLLSELSEMEYRMSLIEKDLATLRLKK